VNIFEQKSEMWEQLSQDKTVSEGFLDPSDNTTHGIGMGRMSDEQYLGRFKDWVERYARTVSPEDLLRFPESSVGNPRIVEHAGYRASVPYLKNFALAKFIATLIDTPNPRMLEIGAGYGGMADVLMRFLTVKSYTIVDLPKVLPLSRYYLTHTHPDKTLEFREPSRMGDDHYDVVINTASFGEMPRETARNYVSWAMKHSGSVISHNSVKRTPSGVTRHSEYGFHHHRIERVIAQPDIAGAYHGQHLVLVVKAGEPNMSAERLDHMQVSVNLGLHEDLNAGNEEAMEAMHRAASAWFFRGKALRRFLSTGKSMLARAYAAMLLDRPIEAPEYIRRRVLQGGKQAVLQQFKKALS
jgi:hypothetical protein